MESTADNDLVRYSRAGDVFHYRWAARRCLRMVHPKSPLRYVTIEGSRERTAAGEYVIDVAEYVQDGDGSTRRVDYYQLKHTTKRLKEPFTLSDLKGAISGFAQRFVAIRQKDTDEDVPEDARFFIITNRPISDRFRKNLAAVQRGAGATSRFKKTLKKYTQLDEQDLTEFCSSLELVDGEGNYLEQRHRLHAEVSKLLAGSVDSTVVDSVTAMVHERALPANDGLIRREDVLQRFGVTSSKELFPAPPEFEDVRYFIRREQHDDLLDAVLGAESPVIIHASGGVGKTVVARQLADSLPKGSLGIIYDCFGAGNYRSRSAARHRHSTALVQIVNEIASKGLCEPLIPSSRDRDEAVMRAFMARLDAAASSLRTVHEEAILVIFVDAADNAKMAADEYGEACFADQILRERIPEGCRLVEFCRTERISLLEPPHAVNQIKLRPFSRTETDAHVRAHYVNASENDTQEFHRLTGRNPRVQANALSKDRASFNEVLRELGPSGTTVDDLIEEQLDAAVALIKDRLSSDYQAHVARICLGLANLPPLIPIDVLAAAAGVEASEVRSFIAEMGRPLWLSDNSVQFRDEPTETWFRERFAASPDQIGAFVSRLKPLADEYPYVSEALPSLLLQAERYDQLVQLALSDDLLPADNPIDARNIRVYRLQFAFKAALKQQRFADAAKLAMRAGEEVAGDDRQFSLLAQNTDLIAPLQSEQRVQELAFRRRLHGGWDGSENVYSASLLSSVPDFHGEARGYLRAAHGWLELYFEEHSKKDEHERHNEPLQAEHLVEMAAAHLNLFGSKKCVDFIVGFRPPSAVFRLTRLLVRRLIDRGDFERVAEIARHGSRNPYIVVAVADELQAVGRVPSVDVLCPALVMMVHKRARIPRSPRRFTSNPDAVTGAIISFAEACASAGLCSRKILRVLRHYTEATAPLGVDRDFQETSRDQFLRQVALKRQLTDEGDLELDDLLPKKLRDEQEGHHSLNEVAECKQVVGALLPWHELRARILICEKDDYGSALEDARTRSEAATRQRWRQHDFLPFELARVRFEILLVDEDLRLGDAVDLVNRMLEGEHRLRLDDQLATLRAAYRLEHLSGIRSSLENACRKEVEAASSEGPHTRADWYIRLARAVLPSDRADASVYFNHAVEAVSKFGDEIVQRWDALVAMARRSVDAKHTSPETAYRFIRCAELVGDNVVREKHWSRDEAVRVGVMLHPASALAGLSRWRDRRVGWFERQVLALAREAIGRGELSPAAGWSLSAFSSFYSYEDLIAESVERETDTAKQRVFLNTAVRDLRLEDDRTTRWQVLDNVAQRFSLCSSELERVVAAHSNSKVAEDRAESDQESGWAEKRAEFDWEEIFGESDFATSEGVRNVITRFDDLAPDAHRSSLWEEFFKRVSQDSALAFVRSVVHSRKADFYDTRHILATSRKKWGHKISLQNAWRELLSAWSCRFAADLAALNEYWTSYVRDEIGVEEDDVPAIREGIIRGLADSSELAGAETYFGFVRIVGTIVSPDEAGELLDYALSRFEIHVEEDHADGPWDNWLSPPDDVTDSFAGFVWSALGAPCSKTRWQAAHCVRRLAAAGCTAEINALVEWMDRDRVGAFGSAKFPFYNLHARLYLLIALARVAVDDPGLLREHHFVFERHALDELPHTLIQRFAANIALSIEEDTPGTYQADTIEQLRKVGVSPFDVREGLDYGETVDSPWHARGDVDQDLELYFSHDFDRYWFEPLASVFGVPLQQVEEVARELIIKEWDIGEDRRHLSDPRSHLWQSSRGGRETWHTHSSYPRTDDYSFYVSYHAMLSVGAKLLKAMPVTGSRYSKGDAWEEWVRGHNITRADGRWLSDRRDPPPLHRPAWTSQQSSGKWTQEVESGDFLAGLNNRREGDTWINVFGRWSDNDGGREESYSVACALVEPEGAQSLLHALATCANPHNYNLPSYQEGGMEFNLFPFILRGWICDDYQDRGIDEFDPFAGDISYPPLSVGERYAEHLSLEAGAEEREWFVTDGDEAVVQSRLWGASPDEYRDRPVRRGMRLSASTEFLKAFCASLKRELVIEVQLTRRSDRSYNTGAGDDNKNKGKWSRVYVFSADGRLRDEETVYRIRPSPG